MNSVRSTLTEREVELQVHDRGDLQLREEQCSGSLKGIDWRKACQILLERQGNPWDLVRSYNYERLHHTPAEKAETLLRMAEQSGEYERIQREVQERANAARSEAAIGQARQGRGRFAPNVTGGGPRGPRPVTSATPRGNRARDAIAEQAGVSGRTIERAKAEARSRKQQLAQMQGRINRAGQRRGRRNGPTRNWASVPKDPRSFARFAIEHYTSMDAMRARDARSRFQLSPRLAAQVAELRRRFGSAIFCCPAADTFLGPARRHDREVLRAFCRAGVLERVRIVNGEASAYRFAAPPGGETVGGEAC